MQSRISERALLYAMFAIVVVGASFGNFSQTATNAMLASIQESFGLDVGTAQLFSTVYMLIMGITVPAVTWLSDRFSLRNLMLLAWGFLVAGALLDVLAWEFWSMMVGRVLQAISAGITMPLMQTVSMVHFPQGKQATAMGIAGIAMGFAPNIGPTIGGAFADGPGWRWFFVVLLALTLVLTVCTLAFVENERKPRGGAHLDMVSLLLSTLGFGGVLLALSNMSSYSPADAAIWTPALVGAVCIVAFFVRQKRNAHPLIDLRIFRSKSYVVSLVILSLLSASFVGISLLVPLFVQGLQGGTAVEAGLVFIPACAMALICNPLSGVLCDKIGARPVAVVGALFLVAGAVSMCFMRADTPLWLEALLQMVRGIGVSSTIGVLTAWGLAGLSRDIVMDGSSFATLARQACSSLGTAVMVLAVTAGIAFAGGASLLGYRLAFGFSALMAALDLVLTVAYVGRKPRV